MHGHLLARTSVTIEREREERESESEKKKQGKVTVMNEICVSGVQAILNVVVDGCYAMTLSRIPNRQEERKRSTKPKRKKRNSRRSNVTRSNKVSCLVLKEERHTFE
jgi:hypothetical protein